MVIALYVLILLAVLLLLVVFAGGCLCQYLAGVRPKRRGDDNYRLDIAEDDFHPSGTSPFKVRSHAWNIWWHKQPLERLELTSFDGLKLVAYLHRAHAPTNRVAIVVHGIDSVAGEEGFISKMFLDLGYHVVALDLRAHGASEGRLIGFGYQDRRDIIHWVGYLQTLFGEDARFVLHGTSMGAAAVMLAAGEPDFPDSVACIVEDSGFSYGEQVLLYSLRRDFKYMPCKRAVVWVACMLQKLQAGFGFQQAACVPALSHATVPMLFVHGDADVTVPFHMLDEVFGAHPGDKQKLVVPGGEHAIPFFADETLYTDTVKAFCDKHFS